MTFSIAPQPADDDSLTFPVVLPNGETAYCPVDKAGRIDPRQAYAPWLKQVAPRPARPAVRGRDNR